MRKIILFLPLLFLLACVGKKSDYIHVTGTRILIIPPTGYAQQQNFVGLRKNKDCGIEAYDYRDNYYKQGHLFNEETFISQGAKVLYSKNVKVDGYDGRMLHLQISLENMAYIMIFGDSTFYAFIAAQYPTADNKTGNDIKKALKKVKYGKIYMPELTFSSDFKLDDSKSIFKVEKSSPNGSVYSIGGVTRTTAEQAYLETHLLPVETGTSPGSVVTTILEVMENVGFKDLKVVNTSTSSVNDNSAYQCEATAINNEVPVSLYILVVTDGKSLVTIQGFCTSDFEKNMSEFQNLARTITFLK